MSEKKKKATKPTTEKIVKDTENIQEEVKEETQQTTEAEKVTEAEVQSDAEVKEEVVESEEPATEKTEETTDADITTEQETVIEDAEVKSEDAEVKAEVTEEPAEVIETEKVDAEVTDEPKSDEDVLTPVETVETEEETIEKANVSVMEEETEEPKEIEKAPGDEAVKVSEELEVLPGAEVEESKDEQAETDSEAKTEENIEKSEDSEVNDQLAKTDTEGELVDSEKEKKDEGAEKAKEPKKPSKFGLFLKAHKALVIIIAIVLLLAAGATATHFIMTKDMVFIHKAEDLLEADKGNLLVFKSDIEISDDITLEGYSFDMNDHSLTVDGILTINGNADETINIGTKKNKEYLLGGTLNADSIIFNGTSATAIVRANINATALNMNTAGVELYGDIVSDVDIANASSAIFYSNLTGAITLGATVNLDYYGSSDSITGGGVITAFDGAISGAIVDADKAIMYPESEIDTISNVGDSVFVEYLAAPELMIIKEGVNFVCYVSEVQNADFYDYSIEGQTGRITSLEDSFVLPVLTPGKYDLTVTAGSTNESYNSARATTVTTVHYTIKLAKPVISIEQSGETVNLIIGDVDNATEYVYTINGAEFNPVNAGTIDITASVTEVGKYTIYVYARNTEDNSYEQSDTVMTSYINRVVLAMSEIVVTDNEDGTFTAEWTAVDNANYYMIDEDGVITYTRASSYIFSEDSITISVKGTGFYVDSAAVTVNSADAVEDEE